MHIIYILPTFLQPLLASSELLTRIKLQVFFPYMQFIKILHLLLIWKKVCNFSLFNNPEDATNSWRNVINYIHPTKLIVYLTYQILISLDLCNNSYQRRSKSKLLSYGQISIFFKWQYNKVYNNINLQLKF